MDLKIAALLIGACLLGAADAHAATANLLPQNKAGALTKVGGPRTTPAIVRRALRGSLAERRPSMEKGKVELVHVIGVREGARPSFSSVRQASMKTDDLKTTPEKFRSRGDRFYLSPRR